MARRKQQTETLDDLILSAGTPLGVLAEKAGLDAKTLLALRTSPPAKPRVATLTKLAKALGVDAARVRAAIEASRAAAAGD